MPKLYTILLIEIHFLNISAFKKEAVLLATTMQKLLGLFLHG
jgi:hypothetical protein